MVASSVASILTYSSSSPPSIISFCCIFEAFPRKAKALHYRKTDPGLTIRAQTLDFSGSFFEGGFGGEDDSTTPSGSVISAIEDKEEPPCPPGLRQYETMAVLRPDMSEDERLALTQKYEESANHSFYTVNEGKGYHDKDKDWGSLMHEIV